MNTQTRQCRVLLWGFLGLLIATVTLGLFGFLWVIVLVGPYTAWIYLGGHKAAAIGCTIGGAIGLGLIYLGIKLLGTLQLGPGSESLVFVVGAIGIATGLLFAAHIARRTRSANDRDTVNPH